MQIFSENGIWLLLLKASGQATVLIVLVLAVQRLLGGRLTPRWRFRLWLLVALRLALPWTVPSAVSVFNFLNFSNVFKTAATMHEVPAVPYSVGSPLAHSIDAAPPPVEGNIPMEVVSSRVRVYRAWLPLGWAAGAFILALGLGINHFRFHQKVARSRPLIDERALNLLENCKQKMGIRTPITLVETTAVDGPSLFGFLRPRLLLPPGFTRRFSHDELRFVFLHELGHVQRHDIPLGWLAALLQILHWFNPLVWVAFYRMRVDRELACDAVALSYAENRETKSYGRTIVKLLENFGDSLREPGLAGIVEDRKHMKQRILMIAQFQKSRRSFGGAGLMFIGMALLTLTDAQLGCKSPAPAMASKTAPTSYEEQQQRMAEGGDKWAAYRLWDSYYRGKNGVQPDPAKADKWLHEFVQNVWVVKFEPVDDFKPTSPEEFLERIEHYAHSYSGQTEIGENGFFRTTKQGDRLVGSFLSNYPDQLKASLAKVPGLKVTSAERISPDRFIPYEQSPQESLIANGGNKWNLEQKLKMAEAGNKWAAYDLWDTYFRGHHGLQPDPAKAEKWLGQLVQNLWVVRFEPIGDFAPSNPGEFLGRIHQHSSCRSGRTDIGAASFFRTTKRGDKLVGSFLSNYPDQLNASLTAVPGLKVTSVERITSENFVSYEASPQESLTAAPSAGKSPASSAEAGSAPPRIIATSPAVGATDVDPALSEITVTFDQDMERGMSWTGGGPEFPPMNEGQTAQWRTKRTCVLPVKLESAHYYRVGINSTSYQNFANDHGVATLPSAIFFTTQGANEQLKARTLVPKVVHCDPDNGSQNVSPAVTELRVTFNVPMGDGCSWCTAGEDDSDFPKGVDGKRYYWTEDKKTCVLPVSLKPLMGYRLSLNAPGYINFQSEGGVPLEPVAYGFKTTDNP